MGLWWAVGDRLLSDWLARPLLENRSLGYVGFVLGTLNPQPFRYNSWMAVFCPRRLGTMKRKRNKGRGGERESESKGKGKELGREGKEGEDEGGGGEGVKERKGVWGRVCTWSFGSDACRVQPLGLLMGVGDRLFFSWLAEPFPENRYPPWLLAVCPWASGS